LKAALALAFVVLASATIATASAGKTLTESLGVLVRYPSVALMTFAWITITFSALELFGAQFCRNPSWDPRKLPPLVKADPGKSQFELMAQLLTKTLFSVWWLAGLHYQYLVFGPGIAFLVMSALGLIVLYFLIRAPDLFVASDPMRRNHMPWQKTLASVYTSA
jgi:hypothetical protein